MNVLRKYTYLTVLLFVVIACEEIITVPNISNDTVVLIAPGKNVTVKAEQPTTFFWDKLKDADSYILQVAMPNFTNAVKVTLDTLVSKSSFTVSTLEQGNYEWRVKGVNASYETTYSSNKFSAAIDLTTQEIQLLTPTNNEEKKEGTITFSWEELAGVEKYELQLAKTDFTNSSNIITTKEIAETTYTQNLTEGTYKWRVKAKGTSSETNYKEYSLKIVK